MRKNFWLGIITEDKYEKLYSKKTKGMCTFMSKTNKKGSAIALLPILVFLLIFIGSGVLTGDFYSMPAIVGFLIALIVAFAQNKKLSFIQKLRLCSTGVGDENILTMCLIFLAAGAFSGAVRAAGGVESTVNLGLSILPGGMAVAAYDISATSTTGGSVELVGLVRPFRRSLIIKKSNVFAK